MIAMPDPAHLRRSCPSGPQERGGGAHVLRHPRPGGEPYEGDPRYVLRRALERAEAMGFDHFYLGPGARVLLLQRAPTAPRSLDRGGYFDLTTLDAASDLRRETVMTLEEIGIEIEYSHHEVGAVPARDRHALHRRAARWPTTS